MHGDDSLLFNHDKIQLMYDYAIKGREIGQPLVARVASNGYTANEEGNGVLGKRSSHREESTHFREEVPNPPLETLKEMEKERSE